MSRKVDDYAQYMYGNISGIGDSLLSKLYCDKDCVDLANVVHDSVDVNCFEVWRCTISGNKSALQGVSSAGLGLEHSSNEKWTNGVNPTSIPEERLRRGPPVWNPSDRDRGANSFTCECCENVMANGCWKTRISFRLTTRFSRYGRDG